LGLGHFPLPSPLISLLLSITGLFPASFLDFGPVTGFSFFEQLGRQARGAFDWICCAVENKTLFSSGPSVDNFVCEDRFFFSFLFTRSNLSFPYHFFSETSIDTLFFSDLRRGAGRRCSSFQDHVLPVVTGFPPRDVERFKSLSYVGGVEPHFLF